MQHWDHISFLHWRVDPDELQPLLPDLLEPDTFEGAAWVGVTPFLMTVRPTPHAPAIDQFPETNVRTYVVGPDGNPGLFFLHMEVDSRWFTGLRLLGLPYVRRTMAFDTDAEGLTYRSHRPGRPSHGYRIRVRPSRASEALDDPLTRFLTARWRAFHLVGALLLSTRTEHAPWELSPADVEHASVGRLFEQAGLAPPAHEPLVHYSTGVVARLAWPRVVTG